MAGYRIEPFVHDGAAGEEAVRAFWRGEGVDLRAQEGRRPYEVLFVALADDGAIAGECSVYLQRCHQVALDLWFLRAFTGREHRMGSVASDLVNAARHELERRFTDGEDTRGKALAMEIENPGLSTRAHAVWPNTGAVFAGANARGQHLRLCWFEGAQAPELVA